MSSYEKSGQFYLGSIVDPEDKEVSSRPMMYDSKNLTTHALCVGMTGSGKTGLGIILLEEAALDGIPAIIIDPKGDMGDLLLTFPDLSAEEFLPWVDPIEAKQKGLEPQAYAEQLAQRWKKGLQSTGQTEARIKELRNSVEMAIYTPASNAGRPLSILSSFDVPSKGIMDDAVSLRQRLQSLTSSLLGLVGISVDPLQSRESIFLSALVENSWKNGQDIDIALLVQQVQNPPFDKIGVMSLSNFYPAKDRMELSIKLNSLLASPVFQAWMQGETLDIKKLLYTAEGKPKLSIISIAHLSDSERMFFVTLLLNQLLSWMRQLSGTSSLRALFYMDEIFGFFPPSASPPSKLPMLTLLKQARAFGLGIALASQNPVDLDYKGLANCGTWFIGKLQTAQDRSRILDGLNAASNNAGVGSKKLEEMLSALKTRVFILQSIYTPEPLLFETRWTLSYLRGPLTSAQITELTPRDAIPKSEAPALNLVKSAAAATAIKPALPSGINELFGFRQGMSFDDVHYTPLVAGFAKLHFVSTKNDIDTWKEFIMVADVKEEDKNVDWSTAETFPDLMRKLTKEALPHSTFGELPAFLMEESNYKHIDKALSDKLYQNQSLTIYSAPEVDIVSNIDESEGDFKIRALQLLREKRDATVQKLHNKYNEKIDTITTRLKRAQAKVDQEKSKSSFSMIETFLSFIANIINAFLGKRITERTITRTGTSLRRWGRMRRSNQQVATAEEECNALQQDLEQVQQQMNDEITKVPQPASPDAVKVETITIRPRKSDISIEKITILWWPAQTTSSHC